MFATSSLVTLLCQLKHHLCHRLMSGHESFFNNLLHDFLSFHDMIFFIEFPNLSKFMTEMLTTWLLIKKRLKAAEMFVLFWGSNECITSVKKHALSLSPKAWSQEILEGDRRRRVLEVSFKWNITVDAVIINHSLCCRGNSNNEVWLSFSSFLMIKSLTDDWRHWQVSSPYTLCK